MGRGESTLSHIKQGTQQVDQYGESLLYHILKKGRDTAGRSVWGRVYSITD